MSRILAACLGLCLALPAAAQTVPEIDAPALTDLDETAPRLFELAEAVGAYQILAIIADESVAAVPEIDETLLGGRGGQDWIDAAERIYSTERLVAAFDTALGDETLTDAEITELLDFYQSDVGRRVVEAELAARVRIGDPEVEEAARAAVVEARRDGNPRIDQLTRFIEVNDFIDRNVTATLNANAAFLFGMADGGALQAGQPEILDHVMGQEPEIRIEAERWLYAYQMLAYDGLSDEEMDLYIDSSDSAAGQALNGALFDAIDDVFVLMQYELGTAAATLLTGDDI
ncbi:DUF2059 domain-containing protein [Rhodobacterales bacterium HKCCE3408]|nr:DUF2059 domain-containing protein [Rhodobacterales bacterium HKCCE3408]